MKKLTGIALILVFFTYLYGIQAFYSAKISSAKGQSALLIQNKEVSTQATSIFTFGLKQYSNLNWTEKNKEFNYNGKEYDIIGLHFTSDEVTVTCYNDSKETFLVDAFKSFMERMFSSPKQSTGDNTDIASKICKEYLPCESLIPSFYPQVLNAATQGCVLVIENPAIASVWHPPCS